MPQPYNYSFDLPNPTEVFLKSFQLGQALKKQALERQTQERRTAVYAGLGPNSTYQDYMSAIKQLPEDREDLLATMKSMGEAKRTALFDAGGKAFALLNTGPDGAIDPTSAVGKLEEHAAAFDNSGDAETAKQLRDAAEAIKLNPAQGRNVLGTMLAITDPEKFRAVAEVRDNKFAEDINNLTPLVGAEAARALVVGREAAKGVVAVTGPDGTNFMRAEEAFKMTPPEDHPGIAADTATGNTQAAQPQSDVMTIPQYRAAVDSLGREKAGALIRRNNIPLQVRNAADYADVPVGASYIDPNGVLRIKGK